MDTEACLTSHHPGTWRRGSCPNPSPTRPWSVFVSMITTTSHVIQYTKRDLQCTEEHADETIFICSPLWLAAPPPLSLAASLGPEFVSHKTEASSSEANDCVHCPEPTSLYPGGQSLKVGPGQSFLKASRAVLSLPTGRVCRYRYMSWAMAGVCAALGRQAGKGLP